MKIGGSGAQVAPRRLRGVSDFRQCHANTSVPDGTAGGRHGADGEAIVETNAALCERSRRPAHIRRMAGGGSAERSRPCWRNRSGGSILHPRVSSRNDPAVGDAYLRNEMGGLIREECAR
jgi:hypothetical protein